MNCPRCGAKVAAESPCITIFECGSECDKDPSAFYETPQCLRNQLATVTAERDAARAYIVELERVATNAADATDCIKAGETITSEAAHFYWNIRDELKEALMRYCWIHSRPATAEKGGTP